MIDWDRVGILHADVGAAEFATIFALFTEEAEGVIAGLDDNAPIETLRADMHFLAGSALNLGFRGLAEFCHRAQRQAERGRRPDIPALCNLYRQSKRVFAARLESTAGSVPASAR